MAVDKRSLLKPSSPVDNNACKSHTAVQLIGCWTICLSLDWQVQHQSEGGEGGIRNCVEGVRCVAGEEQARCSK
eukprot:scaffold89973_cov82-Cyclotella_meneghiniana.AAC.1